MRFWAKIRANLKHFWKCLNYFKCIYYRLNYWCWGIGPVVLALATGPHSGNYNLVTRTHSHLIEPLFWLRGVKADITVDNSTFNFVYYYIFFLLSIYYELAKICSYYLRLRYFIINLKVKWISNFRTNLCIEMDLLTWISQNKSWQWHFVGVRLSLLWLRTITRPHLVRDKQETHLEL